MGRTDVVKYQTNAATTGVAIICGVKMSSNAKAIAGAEPGGNLPEKFFIADCTRNAKSAGLSPRFWKLVKLSGAGPKEMTVPIPLEATWAGKNDGDTVATGAGQYIVTKIPEKGYR
jgi:hypothetical protein